MGASPDSPPSPTDEIYDRDSDRSDTQLVILSAASRRDDRGVELPTNIKGEAARTVVDKLIRAGLLEEVRADGSLPVWRRDDDSGPMALRITKNAPAAAAIYRVSVHPVHPLGGKELRAPPRLQRETP